MPYAPIATVDAALDKIATATMMRLCSGAQPTDRATAVTNTLASVAVAGGDFSKENISGGRRLVCPTKPDVSISSTGSGTYMTLDDGTDLLHANPVQGAPVSVTASTTRDLDYANVEMLFQGTTV